MFSSIHNRVERDNLQSNTTNISSLFKYNYCSEKRKKYMCLTLSMPLPNRFIKLNDKWAEILILGFKISPIRKEQKNENKSNGEISS